VVADHPRRAHSADKGGVVRQDRDLVRPKMFVFEKALDDLLN
jgi:hypothetical protein